MKAVGRAVSAGDRSLFAMATVVAVAVLREGAEVVLFLYGIAASTKSGPAPLLLGGLLGVAAGAAISWLLYRGLVAIPLKKLFSVTGALVAVLAAGMAGQAAAVLAGADLIPAGAGSYGTRPGCCPIPPGSVAHCMLWPAIPIARWACNWPPIWSPSPRC